MRHIARYGDFGGEGICLAGIGRPRRMVRGIEHQVGELFRVEGRAQGIGDGLPVGRPFEEVRALGGQAAMRQFGIAEIDDGHLAVGTGGRHGDDVQLLGDLGQDPFAVRAEAQLVDRHGAILEVPAGAGHRDQVGALAGGWVDAAQAGVGLDIDGAGALERRTAAQGEGGAD